MTFNEQVLPRYRLVTPFAPVGCTEAELKFLEYLAKRKSDGRFMNIEETEMSVEGVSGTIITVGKNRGEETYLVTESSVPDWEGLILLNRVSKSRSNVV